jgi:hypothetical protein
MEQSETEAADEDQDGTGDLRPKVLVNFEACIRQEIAANYVSESVTDVEKFKLTKPALFKLLVKPTNMSVVRCLRNIHPRFQLHPRQAKTRGLTYQEEFNVEVPVLSTESANIATDAVAVEVASLFDVGDQEEESDDNEGSGAKGPIYAEETYDRCDCCQEPYPPTAYAKYEECREQESQPPKASIHQRPMVALLVQS